MKLACPDSQKREFLKWGNMVWVETSGGGSGGSAAGDCGVESDGVAGTGCWAIAGKQLEIIKMHTRARDRLVARRSLRLRGRDARGTAGQRPALPNAARTSTACGRATMLKMKFNFIITD